MNTLLTDSAPQETKYVVKVNGQVRTAPLPKHLAESTLSTLPLEEQARAELVPVTNQGQEILLG